MTTLDAIEGDDGATYWFTPDHVERVPDVTDLTLLNERFNTMYFIAPGDERNVEQPMLQFEKEVEIDLLLVQQHHQTIEPFVAKVDPIMWTIQNRMMQDVEKALLADTSFGGLVTNAEIPIRQRGAEDTWSLGWAVVFAQIMVNYTHDYDAP